MAFSVILAGLLQLTSIENTGPVCGTNEQAEKLASLIMGHESQQRTELQCNELLAEMKIALEKRRPKQITPLMDEFAGHALNSIDNELLNRLKPLIKNFNYSEAKRVLGEGYVRE